MPAQIGDPRGWEAQKFAPFFPLPPQMSALLFTFSGVLILPAPRRPYRRVRVSHNDPREPDAHFGWTSALNRGRNSTRRSKRGKKERNLWWEREKKERKVGRSDEGPVQRRAHPKC